MAAHFIVDGERGFHGRRVASEDAVLSLQRHVAVRAHVRAQVVLLRVRARGDGDGTKAFPVFVEAQGGEDEVPRQFRLAAAKAGSQVNDVRSQDVATGGGAPLPAGASEIRDVSNDVGVAASRQGDAVCSEAKV